MLQVGSAEQWSKLGPVVARALDQGLDFGFEANDDSALDGPPTGFGMQKRASTQGHDARRGVEDTAELLAFEASKHRLAILGEDRGHRLARSRLDSRVEVDERDVGSAKRGLGPPWTCLWP